MTEEESLLRDVSGVARDRQAGAAVDEPLLEEAIARNVRELRLRQGLTPEELAERVGISTDLLTKIENAKTSCTLPILARLSAGLDAPVTTLIREADVERQASFVRAGQGAPIVRNGSQVGHEYELLGALRGEHKRLECLMVTLTHKSKTYSLYQHPGTEFIYMLEGVMDYGHNNAVYRMQPGDSLQIDGEGAHGPVELAQLPIRFLSVIAFPDSTL